MKIIAISIVCLFWAANAGFAQQTTATAAPAASPATDTTTSKLQPTAEATKPTGAATIPVGNTQLQVPAATSTPLPTVSVDSSMKTSTDKPPVVPQKAAAVVEESEEDLILDGGEESIIVPAAVPIPQPKQTVSTDSGAAAAAAIADSSLVKKDSVSTEGQTVAPLALPISPIPAIPEEPAAPARIEKMQSINFAKNYKEYRSPKIAILLSLLLPGIGQAYAHNNLKAGIFGAVEVALITTGSILAYNGSKKTKEAHRFADSLYDTTLFKNYYKSLKTNVIDVNPADSQIFLTYIQPDTFLQYAKDKNQDYYTSIGNEVSPFVQGWKDAKPRFDSDFHLIDDENGAYFTNKDSIYLVYHVDKNGDTTNKAMFGFSDNQRTYQQKLSNATGYFNWSQGMFYFLVVNHIISAVDAGITAKAYNDRLLGKTSVWQKINFRDNFVRTPSGTAQGYALEVRF